MSKDVKDESICRRYHSFPAAQRDAGSCRRGAQECEGGISIAKKSWFEKLFGGAGKKPLNKIKEAKRKYKTELDLSEMELEKILPEIGGFDNLQTL